MDGPVAELRPAIVVTPASPRAFDHDDFSALVLELIQRTGVMADRIDIRLGYLYGDSGEPEWTWVSVILDETGRAALREVVAAITTWGRRWIKKARQQDPNAKPIKALIYGPRGEVLHEVPVPPDEE